MTKVLILFIFVLTTVGSFAQKLSKEDLIWDLTFLNEAVEKGHPVNYNPAKELQTDSLLPDDYTHWVGKGVYRVGGVQTSIRKNPINIAPTVPSFNLLTALVYEGKLRITACEDSTQLHQHILAINGTKTDDLIDAWKEVTLPASKIEITFPAYRLVLEKHSANNAGIVPDIFLSPDTEQTHILQTIKNRKF